MYGHLTLKGKLFTAYGHRDVREDFKKKHLSKSPFKVDALIRLYKPEVRRAIGENPQILDGEYEFKRGKSEASLIHKVLGLEIKVPLDDVPHELLKKDLDGPYCFKYSRTNLFLLLHVKIL